LYARLLATIADVPTSLLFYLANSNINFGKILAGLPKNDVMVLQARSGKRADNETPVYTDMLVHPENDLRNVLKQRRHADKVILKEMANRCFEIYRWLEACNNASHMESIRGIFLALKLFFDNCIQLIADEKLLIPSERSDVMDLHSCKLYILGTRHHLPMKRFLRGFFSADGNRSQNVIHQLLSFTQSHIMRVVTQEFTAELINQFIVKLNKHRDLISHMSGRVHASELGNVNVSLRALLQFLQTHIPAAANAAGMSR
jgi:hypothetical protein